MMVRWWALILVALASPALAATYYVDGSCGSSGTGAGLTCGATGPFMTIGEGINAMSATGGDTLNIRGEQGGFDGVYHEEVWVAASRPAGITFGKALNCGSSPCTIQGYNGERASIMPNQLQTWTDDGSGSGNTAVYYLAMTAAIDTPDDGAQRAGGDANLDPYMLYTTHPLACTGDPSQNCDVDGDCVSPAGLCVWTENRVELPYAGDNVTTIAGGLKDGSWSYNTTNQRVYVNPRMSDNPDTTILVPFAYAAVMFQNPTQGVTWQDLTVGRSRSHGFRANDVGGSNRSPDNRFTRIHYDHIRRFAHYGHSHDNAIFTDCVWQYGARGFSYMPLNSNSYFGLRLFDSPGTQVINPTVRYLGAAGLHRSDGTNYSADLGGAGEECSWCDAPWNVQAFTDKSCPAHAIQPKETDGDDSTPGSGFTVQGGEIYQIVSTAFFVDVVTEALLDGTYIHEVGTCVALNNFTPNVPTGQLYWSNATLRNFTCKNAGVDQVQKPAISICGTDSSERNSGQSSNPLITIYNVFLVNIGYAGIQVGGNGTSPSFSCPNQTTDPGDVRLLNISISGTNTATEASNLSRCLIIRNVSASGGLTGRNIICNNVTREAVVFDANALAHMVTAGTKLDFDLYGSNTSCPPTSGTSCSCGDASNIAFRYGSGLLIPSQNETSLQPRNGTCADLATFKTANASQEPTTPAAGATLNFTSATNLHITAGSAAIDTGESQSSIFTTDYDGDARTTWDKGADEFVASGGTAASPTGRARPLGQPTPERPAPLAPQPARPSPIRWRLPWVVLGGDEA